MAMTYLATDYAFSAVMVQTASYTTTTGASQENPTGFNVDLTPYPYCSATFIVTTNTIKIQVFFANLADFSDETGGVNTTCAAGTWVWYGAGAPVQAIPSNTNSFPVNTRYVRFKVQDAVDGTHGSIALTVHAKRA